MKKFILSIATSCLLALVVPQETKAITPDPVRTENTVPSEEAQKLINRLEEINAIDKSSLSRDEKKALRHEVREIKHSLRDIGGGVYISVGTLILILILIAILA